MKKLFAALVLCAILLLVLLTGTNKKQMALFGFGLNPLQDISKAGNAIGGLFGNNTSPTRTANAFIPASAPTIPQSISGGVSSLNTATSQPGVYTSHPSQPYGGGGGGAAATNNINSSVLGSNVYGGGGGGGASVSSAPAVDPAAIAAYSQAIANTQAAVNRLPAQLQSGYGSIDSSFQNALNQLLLGKNQANSAYGTAKTQTGKDYISAKNTIGANAGSTLSGLLRLLGAHGAGGSSATGAAGQAVARDATLQRQGVGDTFGANNQALDTNWNNYLTGYNNEVNSASNQKDLQRQGLEQNINTNKASLLQSLAGLQAQLGIAQGGSGVAQAQPYLDQANGLLNSLSSYSTAPINYQTQAYTAPSLGSYTSSQTTPTYQGQAPQNDYFSPYLGALLGKKQLAPGV